MSTDWWVNRQNLVYPYNRSLSDRTKQWSTDTRHNVDEPCKYYAKWKKPDAKGHILYDSIYMMCSQEANIYRQKVN